MDIKIIIKKSYIKREKLKKVAKHQRTERNDIKGVITNANNQICYDRIIEIVNEIENIESQQEIRILDDCVIKLNKF